MRVYLLYILVLALAIYAWRDWFVATCGLILLSGISGHADFPKFILGIQGLNPWNILLAVIILAWLVRRRDEGARFDLRRGALLVFTAYVVVCLVAVARAVFDFGAIPPEFDRGIVSFVSDELLNPLKYVFPAVMLYDGCRTRRRCYLALGTVILLGVLYCVLLIKAMPLGTLVEGGNYMRQRQRAGRGIGTHVINLAMISVMVFWGLVACLSMCKTWRHKLPVLGALGIVGLACLLSYSRAGYLAMVVVGLGYLLVRNRRVLLACVPAGIVGLVALSAVAPTLAERLYMGVGAGDSAGREVHDWDAISSGRTTNIWPPVLDQIPEAPVFGHGRRGILRTAAYGEVVALEGSCPGHPHSAYLEMLLDSGAVGLIVAMGMWGGLLWISITLMRRRSDPLIAAVGGLAFAATAVLLVMGIACQSFFPKVEMLPMWCAWALALRAWQAHSRGRPARQAARVRYGSARRLPTRWA